LRMGVYDKLPAYLSNSIGAYETTLIRMTAGYSQFVNGGKKVVPKLIDRIQDRNGKTIYREDPRTCDGCNGWDWHNQSEPLLADQPATPFRVPPGIILVSVDRITGAPESADSATAIQEAFKPGTEPGAASYLDQTATSQTEAKPATTTGQGTTVDEGTGGLY